MKMLICAMFLLTALDCAQAKQWRGIIPLHSTRADVERLLGTPPPERNHPDAVVYKLEKEEVLVRYSTGNCIEKWNVPRDTVIFIHVFPKKLPKLSELKLDLSKYKKSPVPETEDYVYYDNEEEGFEVEVNTTDNSVYIFIYYWAAADKNLRCSGTTKPNNSFNRSGISSDVIRKIEGLIQYFPPG